MKCPLAFREIQHTSRQFKIDIYQWGICAFADMPKRGSLACSGWSRHQYKAVVEGDRLYDHLDNSICKLLSHY